MDIISGVEACHFQGIIHRDIKPENILIDRQGTPKLLDFGASKDVVKDGINSSFAIISEGFSPPEQYTANKLPTPTNDIYSLGATMYYCLTNLRPQGAAEYMHKAIFWPNDRTYITNDGIDLRKIVTIAMAHDSRNRYQTIHQMREDFRLKVNNTSPPLIQGETIPYKASNEYIEISASKGLIIAGYIFSLLGGAIGIAIAFDLLFGKVTHNGEKIHKYNSESRRHGKIMLTVGIALTAVFIFASNL